ncbi:unnamed protein product [Rotaria sordida]|uniref:Uncharacterized protein n=1 Tax=Rotaria sordida TaxID=392033 RepID=A0A819KZQ9_9BILA|nr:unnamed protein product [Rotaria sordida]
MWKTRFEVNNSNGNNLIRHRNLSSSSTIKHNYCTWSSSTIARTRDDSPHAVIRPYSSSSSIPNLEILTEEDEDISCSNLSNNNRTNSLSIKLRKQNSYQTVNRHQIVLPTIVESNDHEVMIDSLSETNDVNVTNKESINDSHNKYMIKSTLQDSFVATNTNYNQVMNVDIERKERTLNTNMNYDMTEFTLDKHVNEILQQKTPRLNQPTSSSTDFDKNKIFIPTTFKDISAFFETKVLAATTNHTLEQKKIVRAKRSLSLKQCMPRNKNNLPKLEIISSTEPESTIFHHQIKRIKRTHKSEFEFIAEQDHIISDSLVKQSISFDSNIKEIEYEDRSKQLPKLMNNMLLKKTLPKQWLIFLLLIITILVCLYLSNLTNVYKYVFGSNPFVYLQHYLLYFFPRQSKKQIDLIDKNVISRYGQFVRNRFFSLLDLFVTFIGEIFFRIDKYEYTNNIVYVVTSTYENIYDRFIHLFK